MRLSAALAVACLSTLAMAADDARAASRKETTIRAQGLGPALQQLARDRNVQLVYRSELVGDRRTSGAVGELTLEEALTNLLKGSGLTYQYIDDSAVIIVPMSSSSAVTPGSRLPMYAQLAQGTQLAQATQSEQAGQGGQGGQETLEEVTVSAQRREQNVQDVPISVVVMDHEAVSRAQVNALMDLPQVAPSLNFENRGVGVGVNFSMRGVGAFAPSLAVQPGVGLVVDEMPFSRNVEYNVDLGDIASVQFLNGPQGTLFGANNIGGVMLITTPQPPAEFEGSLEATETSDDEYILRGTAGGPVLSDRVRARVSLFTKEREGFITNLYPLADVAGRRGGEESEGGNVKVAIDLADNLDLTLIGDFRNLYGTDVSQMTTVGGSTAFATLQGNGDASLGQRVVDDPKLINTDVNPYQKTETWGVGANLSWKLANTVSLKSITVYRELELFGLNDQDLTPASISDRRNAVVIAIPRSNRGIHPENDGEINVACGCNQIQNFKQEIRLQYSNAMFDGILGLYYVTEDHGRPAAVPPSATGGNQQWRANNSILFSSMSDNTMNLETWAGFGDVTWHVSDALDLFAGYRWTEESLDAHYYNRTLSVPAGGYTIVGDTVYVNPGILGTITTFDASYDTGEWAGRAGLMWKMTPDINLYGSVSRGFTGAGVVGSATSPTDAFVSPTTALSYEVGVKSRLLDNRLRLNVAVFQNDLENIQSSLFIPTLQQSILVNAGDFTSRGVELDVTALVGERLRLNAVATLMDTELTSNVFEPCYLGQTVEQGCIRLSPTSTAQSVKGKPGINAPDLKYSVGATYEVPLPSRSFDGRAGINYNWTDERYFELIYDPIGSYAPSYGTLDLNFGISDKDGRYDISLFGKNVLDEHYYSGSQAESGRNGRARAAYFRGAFAYWGVKARFNF